jgi:hypothetical protein
MYAQMRIKHMHKCMTGSELVWCSMRIHIAV